MSRPSAATHVPEQRAQPFIGPFTVELSEPEMALTRDLARLFAASPPRAEWMANDTYTCDGGALAAKLLADRRGIPATLVVGLYWHTDPETRAESIGEERSDDTSDAEWEETLDEIRDVMDEHHHWVVLHPGTPEELLLDPNGPVRDEEYLVRVSDEPWITERYTEHAPYIMYDPADGAETIAAMSYPGMMKLIMQLDS